MDILRMTTKEAILQNSLLGDEVAKKSADYLTDQVFLKKTRKFSLFGKN
jgi:hypothetical protein